MEQHDSMPEKIARAEGGDARRGPGADLLLPDNRSACCIAAAIALAAALVSFFIVAPWAGSPESHADIIASLDEKRDTVMQLIAGSTGTSAAITLLPGDAGTPIAEKLLDLGSYFALVIGAIYLEKYMLTILGSAAFKLFVPAAGVLFAIAALPNGPAGWRTPLRWLSARLALFGIAIFLVVPASVTVSRIIEGTYESTVASTLATLEDEVEVEESEPAAEPKDGFEALGEFVRSIPENLANAATGVSQEVQTRLNLLIETLAVMIVTSCVIPILVPMFFLWLARVLLGVPVDMPGRAMKPRSLRSAR